MKPSQYSRLTLGALMTCALLCSACGQAPATQDTLNTQEDMVSADDAKRYQQAVFNDFVKTANITYGENYNPTTGINEPLKLRLFQPKGDTNSKRPLLIITPGGGFVKHGDDWMENFGERFARAGYVTAITRYRLSDSTASPELFSEALFKSFADQKAAIRFFMHDAATTNQYRIDTNNLFIGGHSAGAITAMYVAFLSENDDMPAVMQHAMDANGGIEGNSGNPGYKTPIRGVINLSGAVSDTSLFKANGTALLSIHGEKDDVVTMGTHEAPLFYGSEPIHQAAKAAGVDSTFYPMAGLTHNSTVYDEECPSCIPSIMAFIKQHLDATTLP